MFTDTVVRVLKNSVGDAQKYMAEYKMKLMWKVGYFSTRRVFAHTCWLVFIFRVSELYSYCYFMCGCVLDWIGNSNNTFLLSNPKKGLKKVGFVFFFTPLKSNQHVVFFLLSFSLQVRELNVQASATQRICSLSVNPRLFEVSIERILYHFSLSHVSPSFLLTWKKP